MVHVQAIPWSFLTRLLCIWLPLEIFDLNNDTSTLSSNASRIDKRLLALLPNCKINLVFNYAGTPRVEFYITLLGRRLIKYVTWRKDSFQYLRRIDVYNSNYVMVLAFHNTILFMCMRTRHIMKDAKLSKEWVKFLLFAFPV